MTVTDPHDGTDIDLRDERIVTGVIMAGPGSGEDLADFAAEQYPDLAGTGFTKMTTQALVVYADKDHNPMFPNREDWRSDAFHRSPGDNKTLLALFGAEHMMGGVSGYDANETSDENPGRVAAVRALVWAHLRSALSPETPHGLRPRPPWPHSPSPGVASTRGHSQWTPRRPDRALTGMLDEAAHSDVTSRGQLKVDPAPCDRRAAAWL